MKGNVAHPSAIGLHGASKVLGGCSTSLDQLLHPSSYTSTTLVFCVVCFSHSTIQLVLAADSFSVAVGTPVTGRPPHRSGREELRSSGSYLGFVTRKR